MSSNKMPVHEALAYLTQLANDYITTLPASAAAPTGALAQQAINALQPLVIGAVPDVGVTPEGIEQQAG